jgi:aspartate aminotransferase
MKLSARVSRISISSTAAVLAAAARLKAEGHDVVDLGPGEPDFPTPDHIKRAAVEAIQSNFTKYTATEGISELKQAIIDRHAWDFNTAYKLDQVLVTVGGKHGIFNLVSALIEPDDEVVVPIPYWVTFRDVVQYSGGRCTFVRTLEEDNFRVRADQIEAALTPKTRLIILNSPNNPSGAIIPESELKKIAQTARERRILILTDECYSHFVYGGRRPFSLASIGREYYDQLVVVGSLSKTYAMTGWRVGYCLGPAELIKSMLKIQSHSTSNVSSISQKAAVEALRGPQGSVQEMLQEYSRRRDFIVTALNAIPGIRCNWPDGAFYVYPNVSGFLGKSALQTASDLCVRLLQETYVAVVPGEAFGTREHIRISYATSQEQLAKGVERIKKVAAQIR